MASQETLRDYYVDKINTNGYVSIAVDIKPGDINPLFGYFKELCFDLLDSPTEQSQAIIDAFTVQTPGRPDDGQGYIRRSVIGQLNKAESSNKILASDNKDVFQFVPYMPTFAAENLKGLRTGVPKLAKIIMQRCTELNLAINSSLRPVLKNLGLEEDLLAPPGRELDNVHVSRLVRYHPTALSLDALQTKRAALGELHFDRSVATVAAWESLPGLIGTASNNPKGNPNMRLLDLEVDATKALATPIYHRAGEMKFFVGAGYNHLTPQQLEASGHLSPLLHGVVDMRPGAERYAYVQFINRVIGLAPSKPEDYEKDFDVMHKYLTAKMMRLGAPIDDEASLV